MDTSDIVQDPSAPLNYTALATQTEGYSVTDLKDLVARAVHRAAIRSSQLDGNEESQRVCLIYMLTLRVLTKRGFSCRQRSPPPTSPQLK